MNTYKMLWLARKYQEEDKGAGEGGAGEKKEPAGEKKEPAKDPEKEKLEATLAAEKAERLKAQALADANAKKLKELEDKEAAREKKRLEDEGKFKEVAEQETKRREEAENKANEAAAKLAQTQIDAEVKIALMQAGITDPELIVLLDKKGIELKDGAVVGVTEAIEAFKKSKPHFFGATKGASSSTSARQPGTGSDGEKPTDVRKMTKEEYKKHKLRFISGLR